MKVTNVNFDKCLNTGLSEINMSRLDKVVLVTGKNGAGKSRLLSKLKKSLNSSVSHPVYKEIKDLDQSVGLYEYQLSQAKKGLDWTGKELDVCFTKEQCDQVKKAIDDAKIKREALINAGLSGEVTTDILHQKSTPCYVDFVPKKLELKDCNDVGKNQLHGMSLQVNHLGVEHLAKGVLSKIQITQNRWYEATHQFSTTSNENKENAIERYERLKKIVYTFLGVWIGRDPEGNATLFDKRLGLSKLSDGQRVLLQLCVAMDSQSIEFDELVLILDEPENHLHPDVLIEVVDKLAKNLSNGQLWIATHSVHLLAHFDASCIWYMESGAISYSGSKPEKVLEGLIGGQDRIGKLTEFLTLPAELAQARFAFQSLLPPEIIGHNEDDPQANQILSELFQNGVKIKVLDFGAGKARLLSAAVDYSLSKGIKVSDWLDYYAYDLPGADDSQFAKNLIFETYGAGERYFDDEQNLIAEMNKNSFDFVLMCNVFHEIEPRTWTTVFNENSAVRCLIKDEGHLMVVEDQFLPVGEKAYKDGFLVFDELQFQILFDVDKYDCRDERKDGRLKAHLLPASCLGNLTSSSRDSAVKSLHHFAKQEIERLRGDEPSYSNGRLHGFWIQQYANSGLYLS